jgi:peptidoglycan hydrolase CwlO-like protein
MANLEDQQKDGSKKIVVILLALFLLGSVAFNVFQWMNKEKIEKNEAEIKEKLVSSDKLKEDLQKELEQSKADLSEFKGKTASLDAMIAQKEAELQEKASKIEKLLKDNKISYNKYLRVKDEMDDWKYNAEKYLAQVQELSEQNKKLKQQNEDLSATVSNNVKKMNELEDQNVTLNNKVALGAQLKAENLVITGIKVKSSGSERETNKASQVQKIKFCFTLPENHITDNGNKEIFIKLTDPSGQPVFKETNGGGTFSLNGQSAKYTSKQSIFYDNVPKNYCIYWNGASDANLQDGIYSAELFVEGYKLGEKNFTLK